MRKVRRKGFTLIELMIVISIIGVLAAIAIPNFRSAREKSNMRACYANQKTILGALEMYNLDYGMSLTISPGSVDALTALRDGQYLQSIPDDPGCKQATNNYGSNNRGDVWCAFHGTIDGTCMSTDGGCQAENNPGGCSG